MQTKVDIVVLYCTDEDPAWVKEKEEWKEREINNGNVSANNPQAFHSARFRDWGMFKYFFRGIEKNCSWVNKVFLVVETPEQVPHWINKTNDKLRIVYHKEFIPKKYLPTFNCRTIHYFLSDIPDLSNNYILFDDDIVVCNKVPKEMFYRDGLPVLPDNRCKWDLIKGNDPYFTVLNNNRKFEYQFMKNDPRVYMIHHQPSSRLKSFEKDFRNKYGTEMEERLSRFRSMNDLDPHTLFNDLLRIMEKCIIDKNMYTGSHYMSLSKKNIEWEKLIDKKVICFNDTGHVENFNERKQELINFLDNLLPDKSEFEV